MIEITVPLHWSDEERRKAQAIYDSLCESEQWRTKLLEHVRAALGNLGKIPSRFDGQHWTPEFGWKPVSGDIRDEKPELNKP